MSYYRERALADLLAERERQIAVEGYSINHDNAHARGELAYAAASRALEAACKLDPTSPHEHWAWINRLWPWRPYPRDKGHDPRHCLIIAGALIIAELERLDRKGGAG
jgi:hypothetical protein